MNKVQFLSASLPYGLKVSVDTSGWFEPKGKITMQVIGMFDLEGFFTMKYIDGSGAIYTDNLQHFTPIIRHIDTLTQECVQADYNNGEPFIPIVELAKMENLLEPISFETMEDFSRCVRGCCAKDRLDNQWFMYYYRDGFSIWHKPHGESEHRPTLLENQLQLFQQLLKWHFWPNKPDDEDVVYVTNEFNPYK